MQHIQLKIAGFRNGSQRQLRGPWGFVDIPSNRDDRCYFTQPIKNLR